MIGEFLRDRKDVVVPIAMVIISLGTLGYNSLNSGGRKLNPFSRFVVTVISYPQRAVTSVVNGVGDLWHRYADLRGAQEENIILRRQMDEFQMRIQTLVEENARLRASLPSLPWPQVEVVSAQIIGLGPSHDFKVVSINRGTTSGIRYGMPVVTGAGVVGKIIGTGNERNVAPTSATVLLLTDPRCRIDALVYRYKFMGGETAEGQFTPDAVCPWNPANWEQTRVRGVIQGDYDKLILKYVSRDADIKPGDRVVSSGLGGIFPKGLLIGTVTSVTPPVIGISPYVEVEPAVNFETLEEVMVIIQKGAGSP